MKICAKINLKTIAVLVVITLVLAIFACNWPITKPDPEPTPGPTIQTGTWDQGKWDVDVWGD